MDLFAGIAQQKAQFHGDSPVIAGRIRPALIVGVIAQGVESRLVIVTVAEGGVDHHQAFGVMPDIQFVGDAHATVQLNGFTKDQLAGSIDHYLEGVDGGRGSSLPSVRAHRAVEQGPGLLASHKGVHHTVLQSLETANCHAELLAGPGVLQGPGVQLFHDTQGFRGHGHSGLHHHGLHQGKALVQFPTRLAAGTTTPFITRFATNWPSIIR